jgi:hypothetical protein
LVMTPALGLLISTVTLSVSTLATVSSSSTHWPSFLTNSAMVPSLMESARKGRGMVLAASTHYYTQSSI